MITHSPLVSQVAVCQSSQRLDRKSDESDLQCVLLTLSERIRPCSSIITPGVHSGG